MGTSKDIKKIWVNLYSALSKPNKQFFTVATLLLTVIVGLSFIITLYSTKAIFTDQVIKDLDPQRVIYLKAFVWIGLSIVYIVVLAALFFLVKKIFFAKSIKEPKIKGIILAAGKSYRWLASFSKEGIDDSFKHYFWQDINRILISRGFKELEKPPSNPGTHKAMALLLNTVPIIQCIFLGFRKQNIRDVKVLGGPSQDTRDEMHQYISLLRVKKFLNIDYEQLTDISEIAHTAYVGLQKYSDYEGDVVLSYSDIIWEDRLIEELIKEGTGDIVTMIDTEWRNNYPKKRIWHDELYAELVFGKQGKIEKIGEIINRFKGIPEWHENYNRVDDFENILSEDCLGEIVGLFKFSPKGRKAYIKKFSEVLKSDNPFFPIAEWKMPYNNQVKYETKANSVHIKKALFGCFLEFLATSIKDLKIELFETQGGWNEIDHWGDLCLANEKLKSQLSSII